MAKLTQFFCIAVAGATIDGREISADWIDQAAASYNPATYAARVNMEHIRGYSPDKPFCAYGDVVAVKAGEKEVVLDGKTEKRKALFAQVDVNQYGVECVTKKQKLYPSAEFAPKFAGTENAYLVGLAMTDSPASIGTEIMKFAAGAGETKHVFMPTTEADAVVLELEPETVSAPEEVKGFFAAFTAFLKGATPGTVTPPATTVVPPATEDANFTKLFGALDALGKGVEASVTKLTTDVTKVAGDLTTLKAELEATPASGLKPRTVATGGEAAKFTATDC